MMKKAVYWAVPALLLIGGCDAFNAGGDAVKAKSIMPTDGMSQNDAQKAYAAATNKMHSTMTMDIHPDADTAFMAGMIPHHQGAVEMAQIVLKYGKDAEVRALAQKVIAAQEAEIKQMQAWLDKRNASPPAKARAPAAGAVDHSKMGH